MKTIIFGSFLFVVFTLFSCSTSRYIEPLKEDQVAINADFGGPLIALGGLQLPIPLTSIGAGYGLTEKTTLFGNMHTTSLVYRTIQVDAGVRQGIYKSSHPLIPNLSGAIIVNALSNTRAWDFRIFPELNLSPYYKYGQWMTYGNIQTWIDFYKTSDENVAIDQILVPAFAVGQQFTNKKETWSMTLEYKRLAPSLNEDYTVVDYLTWSDKGANGIYLSFSMYFDHDHKK